MTDINVYLPDELASQAKREGLRFSQLLRAAVINELKHRAAAARVQADEPHAFSAIGIS